MRLPADAFIFQSINELSAGSVFKDQDKWWLRVTGLQNTPNFQACLQLVGEHAGLLQPVGGQGVMTLSPAYGWIAMVDSTNELSRQGNINGALTLTAQGPVIWGRNDRQVGAYDLTGQNADGWGADYEGGHKFHRWHAELIRTKGPLESLGTLFSVDRTGALEDEG